MSRRLAKLVLRCLGLAPGALLRRRRLLPPRRLLLIALHQRGDVLWLTPLLRALRRGLPACAVDVWVQARGAEVLEGNPRIARLLVCDAVCTDRTREAPTDWRAASAFLRRALLPRAYDAVLDATGVVAASLLGRRAARSGRLLGRSPQGLDLLYDRVLPAWKGHRIGAGLQLARPLGVRPDGFRPELYLGADDAAWAAEQLGAPVPVGELGALAGRVPRTRLVVHPGAGWPAKQPPADWWRKLLARAEAPLLVRGPGEEALEALAPRADWRVPPSFKALGALLLGARRFIGCDSGPAHLAGLAGAPGHVLFGPTDPARVRPWGAGLRAVRWAAVEPGELA